MAHDAHGNLLTIGDVVSVLCTVTEIQDGEEFCNVTLTSVRGRRPDGAKETIYAINTAVTVRV